MFKLKKSRIFVVVFAVLLALSVVAIYVPLLFPPSNEPAGLPSPSTFVASSSPSSSLPNAKAISPSTSTKSLPSSLQGLENDENSLNNIQKNLGK